MLGNPCSLASSSASKVFRSGVFVGSLIGSITFFAEVPVMGAAGVGPGVCLSADGPSKAVVEET